MIVASKTIFRCSISGTLAGEQPQSKLLQQWYEESVMRYEVTIKRTQQVMSFATVQVEASGAYAARSKALESYYRNGDSLKWKDQPGKSTPRIAKVESVDDNAARRK
jgi:hypothetical protein